MRVTVVNYAFLPYLNMEVASLIASLKTNGHDVRLIDTTFSRRMDVSQAIRETEPDIVCFFLGLGSKRALTELPATLVRNLSQALEGVPLLLLGMNLNPICTPTGDAPLWSVEDHVFMCSGESDYAVLQAIESHHKGEKLRSIHIEPQDFDSLPVPDYTLFDIERYFKSVKTIGAHLPVFASRGCPYACRFCRLRRWPYQQKAPSHVLEEIRVQEERHRRHGLRSIGFYDPTFGLMKDTFHEMMRLFAQDGLPDRLTWFCQTRPDLVTDEWSRLAAKAGCQFVELGLDNASERTRSEVFRKGFTNRQCRDAVKNLKQAGISCALNFITGVPGTSAFDDLRSMGFALSCLPTSININPYLPFPESSMEDTRGVMQGESESPFRKAADTLVFSLFMAGLVPRDILTGLLVHRKSYPLAALGYLTNHGGVRALPLWHPFTYAHLTQRIVNELEREKRLATLTAPRGSSPGFYKSETK